WPTPTKGSNSNPSRASARKRRRPARSTPRTRRIRSPTTPHRPAARTRFSPSAGPTRWSASSASWTMPRARSQPAASRPNPRTTRQRGLKGLSHSRLTDRRVRPAAIEAGRRLLLHRRSDSHPIGPNVRLLFGTVFALVIAAAIGLGATWIALTRGSAYGGVTNGAWTGWPQNGTSGIDPYARAMVARTGELPVGSGDGVAFYASADDAGQPLDGRCDVLLSGTTPQARFWTITLYDPEGRLVANSAQRQGFTSQEIIRNADGSFDIMVGPRARPG